MNVRRPRPHGSGTYGQSLYGRWSGLYVIEKPCTPPWDADAACGAVWVKAPPCPPPAWTPRKDC